MSSQISSGCRTAKVIRIPVFSLLALSMPQVRYRGYVWWRLFAISLSGVVQYWSGHCFLKVRFYKYRNRLQRYRLGVAVTTRCRQMLRATYCVVLMITTTMALQLHSSNERCTPQKRSSRLQVSLGVFIANYSPRRRMHMSYGNSNLHSQIAQCRGNFNGLLIKDSWPIRFSQGRT